METLYIVNKVPGYYLILADTTGECLLLPGVVVCEVGVLVQVQVVEVTEPKYVGEMERQGCMYILPSNLISSPSSLKSFP